MSWIATTQRARRQVLISAIAGLTVRLKTDAADQPIHVYAACLLQGPHFREAIPKGR